MGTNPIDRWMSEYALSSALTGVQTISNKTLYITYTQWLEENMTKKYESDAFQFAMHINIKKFPGITKGARSKSGATQEIDFDILKEHFEKEES